MLKENDDILDIGYGNKAFEDYIRNITEKGKYIDCDIV